MSGIDGQAQLSSATVRIFHRNGNGRHWQWATLEQEGNDIFISLPYLFNRIGSTANFSGIQRHSHHGINSQRIEAVDFLLFGDTAGDHQVSGSGALDGMNRLHRNSTHQALCVDVRVEEGLAEGF
jgi:hypothetical protein